ncbi:MAG: hypothetical protein ACR2H3_02750 [Acidimicrobiales bacterium]
MIRRLSILLALLVTVTGMSACGDSQTREEELLEAIVASQNLAAQYLYTDERPADALAQRPATLIEVKGLEQDDFRYKSRVAIDGVDRYDELVRDDALAMRFIDPALIPNFLNRGSRSSLKTNVEGLSVLEALRTRRWVVDPLGAPAPVAPRVEAKRIGTDPVVDGRSALAYVESAVKEAQSVKKWDADSIEPAYLSFEDDFPKPEDGSGVTRYDLVRAPLPAPGQLSGQGDTAVPTNNNFRRMAIYVKDGRVIQVREEINLKGKKARDFLKYMRTYFREANAPEEFVTEFEAGIKEVKSDDELGDVLLSALNFGLAFAGQDPVLIRKMSYDLQATTGLVVDVPTDNSVEGSLAILVISGHNQATTEETDAQDASGTQPAGADGGSDTGGAPPPDASG